MKLRSLPLLIFPMLGALLAWMFRPPETDWQTLEPPKKVRIVKKNLELPDGQSLRFIEVPGTRFALSVCEVPDWISSIYDGETASHAGAKAFTCWLSQLTGKTLRLPSTAEWRTAARAGTDNAEFPWGYGPPIPPEGLNFALESPPDKPGPAFGYGFRDMAGGSWEWTAEGRLLGSAWSEKNPQTLYIEHQFVPPENYAGKDTAIRLLWETKKTPSDDSSGL